MSARDEFQRKTVTADEAVKVVKSGDRVVFTPGREPRSLAWALAARKDELKGVNIVAPAPTFDMPWYDDGWRDSFDVTVGYVFPKGVARQAMDERRLDKVFARTWVPWVEAEEEIDVLLTEVSPPDEHGYCSFGAAVHNKPEQVRRAKVVLAEYNDRLIRTYGDNFVHVSDIDYFVEHAHSGREPGQTDLLGRSRRKPTPVQRAIAENIASLIKDGDTFQIGVGQATELLPGSGVLDNKVDLGWHSEVTPPGIVNLVQRGVINGKRKAVDRGKCVASAIGGGSKEEMQFVHLNPLFELRSSAYVHDIVHVLAQLDNFVSINNALMVDLTGQIASESMGLRQYSGAGGQPVFVAGALLAKNGRAVIVLPSTARDDTVSRILPLLEAGTAVTVPRTMADIVVTEYGIAQLRGRTMKERAEGLIAIAHPNFREELRKDFRQLYYKYF